MTHWNKLLSAMLIITDCMYVYHIYDWGFSASRTTLLWINGPLHAITTMTFLASVYPLVSLPLIIMLWKDK